MIEHERSLIVQRWRNRERHYSGTQSGVTSAQYRLALDASDDIARVLNGYDIVVGDLAAAHSRIAELEEALRSARDWCPNCNGTGTTPAEYVYTNGRWGKKGTFLPCGMCTPLRALLPQVEAAAGGEGGSR